MYEKTLPSENVQIKIILDLVLLEEGFMIHKV